MRGSRQKGFTLVELTVAMFVVAILATMTVGFYRHGLLTESAQSTMARTLVNSLHLARTRALNNLATVAITDGYFDSANTAVVFTAANHGLTNGDYVTLTNLDVHAAMNGATYYVTKLDANQFRCLHYTATTGNDTTGRARCINRASKLTIWKRSAFEATYTTQADQLKQMESDDKFVYDDTRFLVWDGLNASATQAATSFEVSFSSRGFSSVLTGYQLMVGTKPTKPGNEKIITVFPSGKIQPGI